jgi:hypothetical protein
MLLLLPSSGAPHALGAATLRSTGSARFAGAYAQGPLVGARHGTARQAQQEQRMLWPLQAPVRLVVVSRDTGAGACGRMQSFVCPQHRRVGHPLHA